jgi:predicted metal-dependent hydrolase
VIDWLRREIADPTVEVAGRTLPIPVRRNARATRLTLRLAPDGSEVRVTLPKWCASREALAFVHARTGWIEAQLGKVPARHTVEPNATILFRGEQVTIDWQAAAPRTPRLTGQRLIVGGPVERLAQRVQRWLERRAMELLSEDLADFAARAGVPVPALRLTRAQRRWGSCSSGGTVRINWRLVQAPDAVRRSVVAHEVAHCLHFDHSPAFHTALARTFDGNLAEADAWLKAHGRSLYASFG